MTRRLVIGIELKGDRYHFTVRVPVAGSRPLVSGKVATADTLGKRIAEAVAVLLPREVK